MRDGWMAQMTIDTYFLLFQSFLITLDSSAECHNIPGVEKVESVPPDLYLH